MGPPNRDSDLMSPSAIRQAKICHTKLLQAEHDLAPRWRCRIPVLDNANESSDDLRDNRNGHVTKIAGLPAVPNISMTLACQRVKKFERVV